MNNLNNYIIKSKTGAPRLGPYQRISPLHQPPQRHFPSSTERKMYDQHIGSPQVNQNAFPVPLIRGDRELPQSAGSNFQNRFSTFPNYDYVMEDEISAPLLSVPMEANFGNHSFGYGNHTNNHMNHQFKTFSNVSSYSNPFEQNMEGYDMFLGFQEQTAPARMNSTDNALDRLSIQDPGLSTLANSSKETNLKEKEKTSSTEKPTLSLTPKFGKFASKEAPVKANLIAKIYPPNAVTTSIENLNRLIKSCPELNSIFEIYGYCINIKSGELPLQKIILIRDLTGPVMQVSYFEVDTPLTGIAARTFLRVVGTMKSHNRLRAITVRAADQEEQKTVSRLYAVSRYTINKQYGK